MRRIFYALGVAFGLTAIWFGYRAEEMARFVIGSTNSPGSEAVTAAAAQGFPAQAELALLASIVSAIFLTAGAIIAAIDRRSVNSAAPPS